MQCPKCKLHNPDEAMRCDCGYDFDSGQMKESFLADSVNKPSTALTIFGWIFAFGGGIIGILISSYIAFGKTPGGYRFSSVSRKTGRAMLCVSIAMTIFWVAVRLPL